MTSHEFKFIFIHFAKTGGSSIESFFGGSDGDKSSIYVDNSGASHSINERHHMSARDYISTNGRKIWNDYFTFSFVRNPWDWMVSQFNWDIYVYNQDKIHNPNRIPKFRRRFIVETCNSDFTQYILKGSERKDWFKFPSQKEYCEGVEFIGRYENLQGDFEKICKILRVKPEKLPHLKKVLDRPHYRGYYSNETRKIVRGLFEKDIRFFNYEF